MALYRPMCSTSRLIPYVERLRRPGPHRAADIRPLCLTDPSDRAGGR